MKNNTSPDNPQDLSLNESLQEKERHLNPSILSTKGWNWFRGQLCSKERIRELLNIEQRLAREDSSASLFLNKD